MLIVSKIMRNLTLKCRCKQSSFHGLNRLQISRRQFCNSGNLRVKMYLEYENRHAYSIMENKGYAINLDTKINRAGVLSEEQFEKLMREDWLKAHHSEIFKAFSTTGNYCSDNGLSISNKMFDEFIDNLTDNIQHASDKELESLFYALDSWPTAESIRTRNFIEVWAALDDECLKRLKDWGIDEMLSFVALFYKLNVTKYSEFSWKCIQKLASKAKQLSPGQLVQVMFFISVIRKQPIDVHNLELNFEEHFEKLSLDEIAIISMGFFKSKTPLRNIELSSKITERLSKNSSEVHEVSLAALLKVLRYSIRINMFNKIFELLGTLEKEIPRLSVMSIVHTALLGTTTLTLHERCLTTIADKLSNTLPSARLKDLERLVLTYGTFNFVPHLSDKSDFFEKIIDELRTIDRQVEIEKYGRSLACCISYLGLLGYYPVDLMSKVLDPEFLKKSYGKSCFVYGREILTIHNTSLLYCEEEKMNQLSDKVAKVLAKRYTDFVPNEDFKRQFNLSEKLFLDVMRVLREMCGGSDFVVGDHILTHHQRGDIIICYDHNGSPLPVSNAFQSKNFGLIRRPPDSNNWIVFVIAGRNALICDTNTPSGPFQAKVKELKTLGYKPVLVVWSDYNNLKATEEKSNYLNKLIKEALN